jgi:hypothetical protein
VPFCPPQIPHELTWVRPRAASVGSLSYGTAADCPRTPNFRAHPTGNVIPFQLLSILGKSKSTFQPALTPSPRQLGSFFQVYQRRFFANHRSMAWLCGNSSIQINGSLKRSSTTPGDRQSRLTNCTPEKTKQIKGKGVRFVRRLLRKGDVHPDLTEWKESRPGGGGVLISQCHCSRGADSSATSLRCCLCFRDN